MSFRTASSLPRATSFACTSRQLQNISRKRWGAHMAGAIARTAGRETTRQYRYVHRDMVPRRGSATSSGGNTIPESRNGLIGAKFKANEILMDMQAYKPPTTGLLSQLPRSWVPYAELIRLDKQAGTNYLFLPCVFSTLLAAPLTNPVASPLTVFGTTALFYTGALIMRGAGCTVNDLWDRNLDPHVTRTRLRPIARGAISVNRAIPFLGVQLFAGLALLLQFPFQCLFYAVPSLIFVTAYPLAKRITNYPQFVLGLTFSWGAIMGFPALGIDLLSNTPALISAACLYSSCVAWTIVYDMIYAYQDIRDDVRAGIKSIALAQEKNGKIFLSAISAVQVALLAGAGAAISAGPVFYFGTCGGAAATLGYMIRKVDLKDVKDCWAWFKKGAWFTGGAISAGLTAEYMMHYLGVYDKEDQQASQPKRVQ